MTGFLVLSLIFSFRPLVITSALLGVFSLMSTTFRVFVHDSWLKFAYYLGKFNSKVLLTLIFFLCLFPLAVLYRLFHKNMLLLKKDESLKTYFTTINRQYVAKDFDEAW